VTRDKIRDKHAAPARRSRTIGLHRSRAVNSIFRIKRPQIASDVVRQRAGALNLLSSDNAGQKFLKLVMDCYLEQHVHQPTRFNDVLDLVFTSEIQIRDDIQVLAPVDNSDNNVLVWSMQCSNQPIKAKTQLCYNQADYNLFVSEYHRLIQRQSQLVVCGTHLMT